MVQTSSAALSSPAAVMATAATVLPAARLHSVRRAPPDAKVVHLVRHAEGIHNIVHPEETRAPDFLDAALTPTGFEQCRRLADVTRDLDVDVVLSSPLTRCLQTALHSFEPALARGGEGVPLVAHEDWRETVNFLCDARRPASVLRSSFPTVDFRQIRSESDPVWAKYESRLGCHETHVGMRESVDGPSLERRARAAWAAVADRPERNIAVVSHSAMFMHMFTPYLQEMVGVVTYEDEEVRELMMGKSFRNCEMRSVAFEAP